MFTAFLVGIVGQVDFFAGLLDLSEFSQRHQSLSSSRQSGFCWQAGFMPHPTFQRPKRLEMARGDDITTQLCWDFS